MADLPKVISTKVAARFVGLSESTLAKLRLNGNGPVYCKLGRRVLYRPADLELSVIECFETDGGVNYRSNRLICF